MALLTNRERDEALARLEAWVLSDDGKAVTRRFRFDGFPAAIAFMVRAAFEAEKADHHPEWTNVYNRVDVRLTTHDAGGLTARDIAMAEAMDRLGGTG
jgi:4a-hydroxytetrahydrobiopterin dehydratase